MTCHPLPTRVGIIMAGGSGERFWPLSRPNRPKQLLKLTHPERTLLAEAVDRLEGLIPKERVFIATGRHLLNPIQEAGLVPPENVLAEPGKRNTAGCLIYAAAQCLHRFGDEALRLTLTITPADHRVGDVPRFQEVLRTAWKAVEQAPVLAAIGIAPTRTETGYGHMLVDSNTLLYGSTADLPVYRVAKYREKPSPKEIEDFLAGGRPYWNSGIFCWRLGTFLDELRRVEPAMERVVHEVAAGLRAGDEQAVNESFQRLKDISIDYALMEKAGALVMVCGDFPWDDVGAWDALDRFLPHDEDGNIVVGEPITIEAKNCVVYTEPGPERLAVGVVGVEDLVIVATEDAVLVLHKNRAQDVRKVVAALKERGAPQG